MRAERDEPRRPAIREPNRIENVELARLRSVGEALDGDDADGVASDAGLESAYELLIGENEVEVRAVWRRADGLRQAGQAFVQMGEQAVCVQRLQNQPAAEPRLERVDRGPISPEHAVPHGIGAAARRTLRRQPVAHVLDEERGQARDGVRRRQVRRYDRVRGLELTAGLLLVSEAALVVDELAHGIGEHVGRVRDRGAPDRVDVEHPVVGERKERVVRVSGKSVQLFRSGREQIRAAVAPPGEEAAVLL